MGRPARDKTAVAGDFNPRWRVILAGVVLLVAGCGSQARGPAGPPTDPRPNVVLVSIDTLRADHLGSYGYERDTSPFLDSLAARGKLFENAFAQASWTLPSHMSLFTSTYPGTHRVETSRRALSPAIPTLTERLRDAGYATAGYVSWIYLKSEYGFGRGFDRYVELLPDESQVDSATHHSVRAEAFVERSLEWVSETAEARDEGPLRGKPWFLFLHLFDPHMSYEPPLDMAQRFDPSLEGVEAGSHEFLSQYIDGLHDGDAPAVPPDVLRRAKALYDGEIRYVDEALRRFFGELESQGLLENTVVVVTSDHGEEFDDHGSMEGHQWTLYDEVLRVPLFVVGPGVEPGVEDRMVQSIDVAPTILDLVGFATRAEVPGTVEEQVPGTFEGRSLLPLLRGEENEAEWDELNFSQIRRFNLKWALRTPRHKLIYNQTPETNENGMPVRAGFELYDLVTDPAEQHNVFDPDDPETRELMGRLRQLIGDRPDFGTGDAPILSDEERQRLEALGYSG